MNNDKTKGFIMGAAKSAAKVIYTQKCPMLIKLLVETINGGIENSKTLLDKEIEGIMHNPVLPIYITGALIPISNDVDLDTLKTSVEEYLDDIKESNDEAECTENAIYIDSISCYNAGKSKYLIFSFWCQWGQRNSLVRFSSKALDKIPEFYDEIMKKYEEETNNVPSTMNKMYIF